MDTGNIGKWIVLAGLVVMIVGAIIWGISRVGLPLGSLPGDIRIEGKRSSFYFPIVTCIVISVVLTIILNILGRFMR